MAGRSVGAKAGLALKLPQLQNLIKRDPESYIDELRMQHRNFQSELAIFRLKPVAGRRRGGSAGGAGAKDAPTNSSRKGRNIASVNTAEVSSRHDPTKLCALMSLMAHVAHCYPAQLGSLSAELTSLLEARGDAMLPRLRMTVVQSLILLRRRGLITPVALLPVLLRTLRLEDRALRDMVEGHIVADIGGSQQSHKDERTRRALQVILFEAVASCKTAAAAANSAKGNANTASFVSGKVVDGDDGGDEVLARRSLQILRELYRKRIWTDERTVNAIATALLSGVPKLVAIAARFFLGIEERMAADAHVVDEDQLAAIEEMNQMHNHSKKTKKRMRHLAKAVKARAQKQNAMEFDAKEASGQSQSATASLAAVQAEARALFPAMLVIRDPQSLAESLFGALRGRHSNEPFEFKLLLLNLVSRLVGLHKLVLLPFYGYMQRYLGQHQRSLPQVLAYVVQACHDDVPPEEIQPLIRAVAGALLVERCSEDEVALAINTIGAIATRAPLTLEGDSMQPIIDDIVLRARAKEKSVFVAARAVLNMLRETNPSLLHRRARGREVSLRVAAGDAAAAPRRFGELHVADGIEGAELLAAAEEAEASAARASAVGSDVDDEDEDEDEDDDAVEDGWDTASDEDSEAQQDEGWRDWERAAGLGYGTGRRARRKRKRDEERMAKAQEDAESAGDANGSEGREEMETPMHSEPSRPQIEGKRILTAEDFARIRQLKAEHERARRDPRRRKLEELRRRQVARAAAEAARSGTKEAKAKKRSAEAALDLDAASAFSSSTSLDTGAAVAAESLMGVTKRKKASLEERLQSLQERAREKFKGKDRSATGSTNTEKLRSKNYLMVQKARKVKAKVVRSWKQVNAAASKRAKKLKHGVLKNEARKRRRQT